MHAAGIDIGSRTIKTVLLTNGAIERWDVADAASRPLDTARMLLADMPACTVIATGYGRDAAECALGVKTITEIKAHALGARFFFSQASGVIDMGGQDLKVIALDTHGRVKKFEMNDRCAAGTGKFIEIMARKLEYSLEEFGPAALRGNAAITLNSTCTVFAESEVIGLVNRNIAREDIARAVHRSVTAKIIPMFRRVVADKSGIVLSGGGAMNTCLAHLLGKEIGETISIPQVPQIVGALGAAIIAQEG